MNFNEIWYTDKVGQLTWVIEYFLSHGNAGKTTGRKKLVLYINRDYLAADASHPGVEGPDATLEHPSTDQGQSAVYEALANQIPTIYPSPTIHF
uniref:SFRICE_014549 n=1 Tax=Spodoptera frugiperda TaxID=7108 RepID=A0A2H1WKI6_SPOFR